MHFLCGNNCKTQEPNFDCTIRKLSANKSQPCTNTVRQRKFISLLSFRRAVLVIFGPIGIYVSIRVCWGSIYFAESTVNKGKS